MHIFRMIGLGAGLANGLLAGLAVTPAAAQTAICADATTVSLHPIVDANTPPPYPTISQRLGEQGVTALEVQIGADGKIIAGHIQKSSGVDRLDLAALDFIQRNWQWQPLSGCGSSATIKIVVAWLLKSTTAFVVGTNGVSPVFSNTPADIPHRPPACTPSEQAVADMARQKGYQYAGHCNDPVPPMMTAALPASRAPVIMAPIRTSESVTLGRMTDWQLTGSRLDGAGMTQNWVRKGETAVAWSEMVTLNMIQHPSPMPPSQWIKDFITRLQARCGQLEILAQQDGMQADALRAAAGFPASYPVASALVHCTAPASDGRVGESLKQQEAIWIKAMRGFSYGYLVTRDWHGDAVTPDSVILSGATRQDWQNWIDQIRVTSVPPKPLATTLASAAAGTAGPLMGSVAQGLPARPTIASLNAAIAQPEGGNPPDPLKQVDAALAASPSLSRQMHDAAMVQHVDAIRIRYLQPAAMGRFGARAEGGQIDLTAGFLAEQANNHLYDVVTPDEIYPNSLVFVLGHLAYHIAQPPPTPEAFLPPNINTSKTFDATDMAKAYLKARLRDEAQAWIQGWNDMIDAATRQNGKPLTFEQSSQMMINFRYRAPFFKAIGVKAVGSLPDGQRLNFRNDGTIGANDANIDVFSEALQTIGVPDFD